jgi:endonuclease/exonuclease/phosphatase family metal-dependent hydrolase
MEYTLLHLNIERNKHLDAVFKLLKEKNPDIVCLEEVFSKDAEKIASQFVYNYLYSPLFIFKNKEEEDQLGSAIFSKFPIINIQKNYYGDIKIDGLITVTIEEEVESTKTKERIENRFEYNYTLLSGLIQLNEKNNVTVCTTHFPVTDHQSPSHEDHDFMNIKKIDEIERSRIFFENLVNTIHSFENPIIFTADLNNPRGEYIYDSLTHELVDQVPADLKSSLDPNLHRVKNLNLMVDTIMTTPDIKVKSFEVIEGVSDHKAFLISFYKED